MTNRLPILPPVEFYRLCEAASKSVYAAKPPNEKYAASVRDLLFGTGLHESDGLKANRQYGFPLPRYPYEAKQFKGAFGIMQCEWGSIKASVEMCQKSPALAENVGRCLFGVGADREWALKIDQPAILQFLVYSPRASVVFARLHYLRVVTPIPETLNFQAEYYKRFYNTYAGKATPDDFILAFKRGMAAVGDQ